MIDKNMIEEVKRRLVKAYNPLAIYIFGSYAWGNPTLDSDLDLLVVVDETSEKSYKRPVKGYCVLTSLGISNDIIVYTKKEFDLYNRDITRLCYKIVHEGEKIYGES